LAMGLYIDYLWIESQWTFACKKPETKSFENSVVSGFSGRELAKKVFQGGAKIGFLVAVLDDNRGV